MTFENVGSVENTEVDSRFKLNKFGRVVCAGVYTAGVCTHTVQRYRKYTSLNYIIYNVYLVVYNFNLLLKLYMTYLPVL